MAIPSNSNGAEFHGVVFRAQSCRRQQKSQNLRIGLRRPTGQKIKQQKHQQPAEQAVEQVEGGRAQAHRKEEELSLGPEDREWPRERPMHSVDSSAFRHVLLLWVLP